MPLNRSGRGPPAVAVPPVRTIKIEPRLVFGKPSLLLLATNAAEIDADAKVDAPVGGEPAAGTRRLTSALGTFETCRPAPTMSLDRIRPEVPGKRPKRRD
jgi:hypothetical protein